MPRLVQLSAAFKIMLLLIGAANLSLHAEFCCHMLRQSMLGHFSRCLDTSWMVMAALHSSASVHALYVVPTAAALHCVCVCVRVLTAAAMLYVPVQHGGPLEEQEARVRHTLTAGVWGGLLLLSVSGL